MGQYDDDDLYLSSSAPASMPTTTEVRWLGVGGGLVLDFSRFRLVQSNKLSFSGCWDLVWQFYKSYCLLVCK